LPLEQFRIASPQIYLRSFAPLDSRGRCPHKAGVNFLRQRLKVIEW
jgi:hypothetical protein